MNGVSLVLQQLHLVVSKLVSRRSTILDSIVETLSNPVSDPNTDHNSEAGELFRTDRIKYDETVREWVQKYAQ